MILLDMSHIAISNILSDYKSFKGEIDQNLFKHMIITSILNYKQQFSSDFGDVVICCDSRSPSWRKQQFPHYKANRKKENTFVNWADLYKILNSIINDLTLYFPYRVIYVDGAEGDDCIAALARYSSITKQPTVVVSNDKDFIQLLKYQNVQVYSTKTKQFIVNNAYDDTLLEHIITGDSSDGIPNILSIEESFVAGRRQTSVSRKLLREEWIPCLKTNNIPSNWDDTIINRFNKNKQLIDFDQIPKEIYDSVVVEYNKPIEGDKQKVMKYFMENRMRNLLRDIGKV